MISFVMALDVGDYVTLVAHQTSGTTLEVYDIWLAMVRVGGYPL